MKRAALAFALIALATALPAEAQSRIARAEPQIQPAAPKAAPARLLAAKSAALALGLPSAEEMSRHADSSRHTREGGYPISPHVLGFPRDVEALATEQRLLSRLSWQELPGGRRVASVSVTSHGAAAVRLGVYVSALPVSARLRFAAPGGAAFEFTGEQVLENLANNLESGAGGIEARTFWSPVIESSTAVLEIELPAGVPPEHLRMGVPLLSHLLGSAENGFANPKRNKSCQIDVSCHTGSWGVESNAVARVVYTVDGVTYACSGTLLADQDPSTAIPYFHTAHHCIPSQAAATTMVTYWFYRSRSCDSNTPARYEVRPGGAVLLHTDRETDVSFLRLNADPPPGALYAGWTAAEPLATGTPVVGIHHPSGELQKISFGRIDSYVSCRASSVDGLMCGTTFVPDAKFYSVSWNSGVTDAGSSGSGLFLDNGRYLVGQLFGGSSSCEAKAAGDYYARFDVSYRSALSKWLGQGGTARASAPRMRLRLSTSLSIPRGRER